MVIPLRVKNGRAERELEDTVVESDLRAVVVARDEVRKVQRLEVDGGSEGHVRYRLRRM